MTSSASSSALAAACCLGSGVGNRSHNLFCDMILIPLVADDEVFYSLPAKTTFIFSEEDILAAVLSSIHRKCPELYKDRDKFMRAVENIVYPQVTAV